MRWAVLRVSACVLTIGLAGCASVSQETTVAGPVGQSVTAGIGDTVFKAEGRESMPNAFGNADVFGRTRSTGLTTIQYGGLQGTKVVLLRSGVATQSDATSMNSTGRYVANPKGGGTYIPPTGSTSVSTQQPTIPILVDWKTNPVVPVAGKSIVIEAANATSLTYRIE